MPIRSLPDNPSFEHLKKQAKRLLDRLLAGERDARAEVNAFHPKPEAMGASPVLADAQLVTARSYGFPSWTRLKEFLEGIAPYIWNEPEGRAATAGEAFVRVSCLTYARFRLDQREAERLLRANPGLAAESIWLAAAIGDVDEVRVHLDREPELVSRKGGPFHWEPLLYACYSRYLSVEPGHSLLDVSRLLLDRGADANAGFLHSGIYPFTALTGAFGRGEDWNNQPPHGAWRELAGLLLARGADPNDLQALYNRHFHLDDEHLRMLLAAGFGREKGGPWFGRMAGGMTPAGLAEEELVRAARMGMLDRVKMLVESGVSVDARRGRSAYEEATRRGHSAVAAYLLAKGAEKRELDGMELFAMACAAGRREEAKARLAADAGLWGRLGFAGQVELLHRAGHNVEGIRLAVELGADINGMVAGTGMDRTLLHNAAAWGPVGALRFLLDLGADPNLLDLAYGSSPVGWALYHGRRDNAAFLLPLTGIFDAVRFGDVDRIRSLRAEIGSVDGVGNPVSFMVTPRVANLDAVIAVLNECGVDWGARNAAGRTARERAVEMGWTELAERLG